MYVAVGIDMAHVMLPSRTNVVVAHRLHGINVGAAPRMQAEDHGILCLN